MTSKGGKQSRNRRLGTAFHETFPLIRPAVAAVLEVVDSIGSEEGSVSLTDLLKERTTLGANYIKSMPRYAFGSGTLAGPTRGKTELTALGDQVRLHDPNLSHPATQWLMHYHLSSPHGPGPAFWNRLVTRSLRVGDELQRGEVAQEIARTVEEDTGKQLAPRTAQSTATVFLGTYAKSDGLGPLRILESIDSRDGAVYRIQEPVPPPLWSLAYALADCWESIWGQQATVNLAELTEPGEFASIFSMGSGQLELALGQLQDQGALELYRTAPPYQVVRLWTDKNALLERIYE